MLKRIINKIKNEKGQAVVELAITLPILLMILCGIIDFGWFFINQNIVDHASREGARYAIIHAADSDAVTKIKNYTKSIAPSYVAGSLIIKVTFSNSFNPRLGDVTVEVGNEVEALTPVSGIFISGQTVNINSLSRMKVE